MRRRADRHLAAAAQLVKPIPKAFSVSSASSAEQPRGRGGARDEAEELRREPAFGHRPVGNVDRPVETHVNVHAAATAAISSRPLTPPFFPRARTRPERWRCWVAAPAHVVVIEHVAEAAVGENRP